MDNFESQDNEINDEFLLQCVSNYKPLHDKTDKGYKSVLQKENCWSSVARSLQCPVPELKARFKSLREKYRRELQMEEKLLKSGAPASARPTWPLMSFFKYMNRCGLEEQRPTTSNFSQQRGQSSYTDQTSSKFDNIYERAISQKPQQRHTASTQNTSIRQRPYSAVSSWNSEDQLKEPEEDTLNMSYENDEIENIIIECDEDNSFTLDKSVNKLTVNIPPENPPLSVNNNPVKRKRKSHTGANMNFETENKQIDNVLLDVSDAIKNISSNKKQESDKYELFGKYLASELKDMGEPNANLLLEELQVTIINYKRSLRCDK